MREALEQILMEARSIDHTGDKQIDSYVDSIIRIATEALKEE